MSVQVDAPCAHINYVCLMSLSGYKTDAWPVANEQPFVFLAAWTKLGLQRVQGSAAGPQQNHQPGLITPVWAPSFSVFLLPNTFQANLQKPGGGGWRLAKRFPEIFLLCYCHQGNNRHSGGAGNEPRRDQTMMKWCYFLLQCGTNWRVSFQSAVSVTLPNIFYFLKCLVMFICVYVQMLRALTWPPGGATKSE